MVSRWSRVKAGCAFALACVLPCAFTPGAFAADDGRWPVVNDTVASAWKQGIDGSGVKVAVLDTQAVEDYPALKDADITYRLGRFSGMGGNEVECKVGDSVKAGDVLVVLEAMKMENEIMCPRDGVVASVNTSKGASVESGTLLCVLQ